MYGVSSLTCLTKQVKGGSNTASPCSFKMKGGKVSYLGLLGAVAVETQVLLIAFGCHVFTHLVGAGI